MRTSMLTMGLCAAIGLTAAAPEANARSRYESMFFNSHGNATCYARTYDLKQVRRGIPYRFTVDLDPGSAEGTDNNFALRLSIQLQRTKFLYWAVSYCKVKDKGFVCQVEGDGGQFRLTPVGTSLRLTTRRIQIEGNKADLDLSAKNGKDRYFTLLQSSPRTCAKVYGN